MSTINPSSQRTTPSLSGKIGLTLFGLIFLGMGLLFTGIFLNLAYTNYSSRSWEKTPCTITESRVDTVSGGYAVSLAYQYEWKGNTYSSRLRSPGGGGVEKSVNKADAWAAKYPEGAGAVCFVNPDNPAEAVLARGNRFFGLIVLFPLVFVAIGGGIIYGTWFYVKKIPKTISVSTQAKRRKTGKIVQAVFFLVFFLAGVGIGYFLILPGIMKSIDAKNWVETPSRVLESRVQSHSDSDGTTYSVDILYTYSHAGRNYRSSQYEFIGGSSSGYDGKAAVVRQYPAGGSAVCYVNPDNPGEAVLKRELGAKAFLALIPLAFLLVGLAGMAAMFRKKSDATGDYPGGRSLGFSQGPIPRNSGQTALTPKTSYAGKVIASAGFAIFWNGIVSVFVFQAAQGWRGGHPDYFLTVFLIPFVVTGLAAIGSIFYFFLAAFNPRPVLTLLTNPVHLGDNVGLRWTTNGNVYKIQNFKLSLTGEETATYRQGKNTRTDRHRFYHQVLVDSYQPEHIRKGETAFQVPGTSMHSFKSASNAITWKLTLHYDVPMWPDSDEEFEISVLPRETGGQLK
ncbi:MAG: DUF3592 domain-containing protein [Desulfosalsimonadaceae bacterium]